MKEFLLEITTPEGNAFDGNIIQLSVRSVEGELAVMAGHIPFVASLVPGQCRVYLPDGSKMTGDYDGGLLVVTKEKVTLITSKLELS